MINQKQEVVVAVKAKVVMPRQSGSVRKQQ
jgi:hypothetical protein